jgi:hypothetical protein
MKLKLSSGASCSHWSSLRCFYKSPPVLNSINWTWFGKAHTCLYKVPQLTVHVRGKTKPWGRRNCPYSSETGLRRGTDLGKRTKTFLQHCRSPRTHWPPSFLNGGSLEPPRFFLELAARPNWAIGGEWSWSKRWPSTRWSLTELEFLCRLGRTLQKDNHLCSTNQAFMVEWPDGSHSSVKGSWQPGGNLAPSLRWTVVVAASCCGDGFQWQGLGD